MPFNERLRSLRQKRGLTQKQLAEAINTTERNYQRYEYGSNEPTLHVLVELANFFDVPIDYLTCIGMFAQWDEIMENRVAVEEATLNWYQFDISWMREEDLMRMLPALYDRIEVTKDPAITTGNPTCMEFFPLLPAGDFLEGIRKRNPGFPFQSPSKK